GRIAVCRRVEADFEMGLEIDAERECERDGCGGDERGERQALLAGRGKPVAGDRDEYSARDEEQARDERPARVRKPTQCRIRPGLRGYRPKVEIGEQEGQVE